MATRAAGSSVAVPGQVLFSLRAADMQLTTDQAFSRQVAGSAYRITDIIAVRKSGAASALTAGGIYTAASKGGSAIVAAAQAWATLAAGVAAVPTLAAAVGAAVLTATPVLSLTTGSSTACTADIFIFGYCID